MSNIWLEMDKEVAHWKRLLLKYGGHLQPCKDHQMHPECSCGWDGLQETLEKETKAHDDRVERRKK